MSVKRKLSDPPALSAAAAVSPSSPPKTAATETEQVRSKVATAIVDVALPLNDQPYYFLRATVMSKSTFFSRAGSADSFSVIIGDATGTIRLSFVGDAAVNYYEQLEVNGIYLFVKPQIKVAYVSASPTASTTSRSSHPFELVWNNVGGSLTVSSSLPGATTALPKRSPPGVESVTNLGSLADTPGAGGSSVRCVVAVVLLISPVQDIQSKKQPGSVLKKIDIVLYDKSCKPVLLSVWGERLPVPHLSVGHMLVLEDLTVSTFNQRPQLGLGPSSVVYTLDAGAAPQLYGPLFEAYKSAPSRDTLLQAFPHLMYASASVSGTGAGPTSTPSEFKTIEQVYDQRIGDGAPPPGVEFNLVGTVGSLDLTRPLYYQGCGTCKKKVTPVSAGSWKCEGVKCSSMGAASALPPKCIYNVSLTLTDATHQTLPVRIFADEAQKLLGGRPAEEIEHAASSGNQETLRGLLDNVNASVAGKSFTFTIRASPHEYNGRVNVQYDIRRVFSAVAK